MKKWLIGILIVLLFLLIAVPVNAQKDKDKKTYELIYKDVQILKQQILRLEEKLKTNTEDIKGNKSQLDEVLNQLKYSQARQAALKEDLKILPSHMIDH